MFLKGAWIGLKMIKTVIFDLGNVILNVDRSGLYKEWAEKSGKGTNQVIDYYMRSKERRDFELGRLSPKEFCRKIAKGIGLRMDFEEFKKSYCEIFTLNKDVEQAIKKLKSDFRLVLLSNTDELHFEYIKNKFKIVNIFDGYVLSYEVGMRKPNPLIFFNAIRKSEAFPFNCLYFDDIPEFVFMAKLMGIKASRFVNSKKLISDLESSRIFI